MRFIIICLLGILSFARAADRPDVLFFVVDDMNDWISLLDSDAPIETPNLERLASRGMLFSRAYCASAACNPSRVATTTGIRPTTSGVYGNKSDWRKAMPERKTIFQQFRDAGYFVTGAGKIFHHHLNGAFHDEASFEAFEPMREQLYPPEKLNRSPEYGSANTDWGVWPPAEEESIDAHTVEATIEQLRNAPEDRPLFLACGIFKPHSPFFSPAKYHNGLEDIGLPVRNEDDWKDLPSGAAALMAKTKWFWKGMMEVDGKIPGSYQKFIESYAACCRYADASVGKVLDALDESPRGKDTIIVLWSDHGFHLGEKDHIEKFALWEKTNHIPFIVVAPGIAKPDSVCEAPVDLTALYPTLLDLCGLESDPECEGESLVPLLKDPAADWKRPALMTYGRGNHAVRTDRWRYIRYADGTEELYDHDIDPNEWTNLAGGKEFRGVIEELRTWIPETEAPRVSDLKKPK